MDVEHYDHVISERVGAMKRRAFEFLNLSKELLERGLEDISSFHVHQACQLRLKASILRIRGEIPRIHGVRELIGILAKILEELDRKDESRSLTNFTRDHRDVLIDLDDAYTTSRYAVGGLAKEAVREMIGVAEELFRLLDEVERNVLG
jgi:HEPN domain-containing protein